MNTVEHPACIAVNYTRHARGERRHARGREKGSCWVRAPRGGTGAIGVDTVEHPGCIIAVSCTKHAHECRRNADEGFRPSAVCKIFLSLPPRPLSLCCSGKHAKKCATSKTDCTPCEKGTYMDTAAHDVSSCKKCNPGFYQDTEGQTYCKASECTMGQYVPVVVDANGVQTNLGHSTKDGVRQSCVIRCSRRGGRYG